VTGREADRIVAAYVRAMERGRDGIDELVGLFAHDGEYHEPFTGHVHRGHDAIRSYLAGAAADAPRDVRLEVRSLRAQGSHVTVEWTCHSPVFATPSRGRDLYTIADGRILALRTKLTEPPTLAEPSD
jgi:ketosteroid isomerase-like protein